MVIILVNTNTKRKITKIMTNYGLLLSKADRKIDLNTRALKNITNIFLLRLIYQWLCTVLIRPGEVKNFIYPQKWMVFCRSRSKKSWISTVKQFCWHLFLYHDSYQGPANVINLLRNIYLWRNICWTTKLISYYTIMS